jgi:hypothetical protein
MKNAGYVMREFGIRVARENCHCRRIHGFTSPDDFHSVGPSS